MEMSKKLFEFVFSIFYYREHRPLFQRRKVDYFRKGFALIKWVMEFCLIGIWIPLKTGNIESRKWSHNYSISNIKPLWSEPGIWIFFRFLNFRFGLRNTWSICDWKKGKYPQAFLIHNGKNLKSLWTFNISHKFRVKRIGNVFVMFSSVPLKDSAKSA